MRIRKNPLQKSVSLFDVATHGVAFFFAAVLVASGAAPSGWRGTGCGTVDDGHKKSDHSVALRRELDAA
jgi:hypothetical protein